MFFMGTRRHEDNDISESGFVLVLALVILLMVSLFGIWALQTSTSELQVAGGSQQVEQQFNITEGAAYTEAGKVGFAQLFYQIADPNDFFQLIIPLTDNDSGVAGDFDPGADTTVALTTIKAQATANYSGEPVPVNTWPWENLLQDYTNPSTENEFDYRYLTTYLYADTAPIGYDAASFGAYKFRIQSAAPFIPMFVELGGTKIGPK